MEKILNTVAVFVKKISQPSLLKEAFKITIRNGRLVLFITFIMFSCYSLMGVVDRAVLGSVVEDFMFNSMLMSMNRTSQQGPHSTLYNAFIKDLRFILAVKFVEWAFLYVVLTFAVAASVHSTYEAHTAKQLGLKDMLCGLRGKIKRPLKTSIWMIIISLGSAVLLCFTIGFIEDMTKGSVSIDMAQAVLIAVLILVAFYYVCVFALWMLSLVVSVLEENTSGLKAIYQANELMKGKKLKGFGLMVLLILISVAMHKTFALLASLIMTEKATLVGWAFTTLLIWPYCVLKIYAIAVYTLFYDELKQKQLEGMNRILYTPVATIAEV